MSDHLVLLLPKKVSSAQIDALLPQTQCGQCGYTGCQPYAEAIAAGQADINRCPPGGLVGMARLAEKTGLAPKPFAADGPQPRARTLALIDESLCIGCTLCIQACPVDAILGAAKHMHTVIAAECTGCERCVAPCPVDAIQLIPHPHAPEGLSAPESAQARARYRQRQQRLTRERAEKNRRLTQAKTSSSIQGAETHTGVAALDEQKQAVIAAAMRRAAERQAQRKAGESSE